MPDNALQCIYNVFINQHEELLSNSIYCSFQEVVFVILIITDKAIPYDKSVKEIQMKSWPEGSHQGLELVCLAFCSCPSQLLDERGGHRGHFSCAWKGCTCSCSFHRICHNLLDQTHAPPCGEPSNDTLLETAYHTRCM